MAEHHCSACALDAAMRAIPASVWWPIMSQLTSRGWADVGYAGRGGDDALLCENQGLNAVALRWDDRRAA